MADDDADTWKEFHDVVQKKDGGESTGHASGRRIIEILHTKKSDLSDDDYAHMRKVVGYAKRHLAQRPSGDIEDSAWRYSLKNWGHDPVKKSLAPRCRRRGRRGAGPS